MACCNFNEKMSLPFLISDTAFEVGGSWKHTTKRWYLYQSNPTSKPPSCSRAKCYQLDSYQSILFAVALQFLYLRYTSTVVLKLMLRAVEPRKGARGGRILFSPISLLNSSISSNVEKPLDSHFENVKNLSSHLFSNALLVFDFDNIHKVQVKWMYYFKIIPLVLRKKVCWKNCY